MEPWGGGASDLKEYLETSIRRSLGAISESIGIVCFTLEDDLYVGSGSVFERHGLSMYLRPLVIGELIRDWALSDIPCAIFPYEEDFSPLRDESNRTLQFMCPYPTGLANNVGQGRTASLLVRRSAASG